MASNFKFSTAGCAYCRLFGRKSSRIPQDIRDKCLKKCTGGCFACQKLTDIERKIADARCALQSLLDAREELASTLNAYHDPFVHRLPLEITSSIFVHCRPVEPLVYTSALRHDEKKLTRAVLSLGRVCQSWRKISRSTPELWTIFCVSITPSNCVPSVVFTNEWLERSGVLPLSIQIDVEDNPDEEEDIDEKARFELCHNIAQKVIAAAAQHAHRWELLDLQVPSKFLPMISTFLAAKDMHRLRLLKLYSCPGFGDEEILHLNASPQRVVQKLGQLDQISIDWTAVTHTSIFQLDFYDAIDLFQNAPNLLSCEILYGDYSDDHSLPESYVVAPALLRLEIRRFPFHFWDYFTFPSLVTLHLTSPNRFDGGWDWTRLQNLLRRSSCSIQELSIKDASETPDTAGLIDVLKLTPDLKRLTVSGILVESVFCSLDAAVMFYGNMPPTTDFLKNLESVRCETNQSEFNWSPLVAFLTNMTFRSERSLYTFDFKYTEEYSEEVCCSIMNRDVLKCVLEVVHGLKFKLLDYRGLDLLGRLRRFHKV
ncbi:hypothetical protein CPB83DRAFT_844633 [Crepidotus variabilis]|uniref:F-box domain-containing protein n=1 Tax=Crepidotus variabilis TaxID=179855 RepID=A0A9P6JVF5_9AGAR|nr:hypothetical protein CPB83DRAFT_844633 [Crepidotus variabilis]